VHVVVLNLLETVQYAVVSRQKEAGLSDSVETREPQISHSARYFVKFVDPLMIVAQSMMMIS
jgi:hypothetical protein